MRRRQATGRKHGRPIFTVFLCAAALVALPSAAAVQAHAGPLELLTVKLWPAGTGTRILAPGLG
jgi:hypothetical protein